MSEEEQPLDELEADYRAALKKKVDFLKFDNEAREKSNADEKAKKDADELAAQKLQEADELEKKFAEKYGLVPKVNEPADPPTGDDNNVTRTGGNLDTKEGRREADWQKFHSLKLKQMDIKQRVEYGSDEFIAGDLGFAFVDSDADCGDDVSAWSPADVFCDLVWQAAQCGRQLAGVITQRGCDINIGDGLSVQIRAINADTFGTALAACECATCVSNVYTTYTITLHRYDLYKVVCHLDIWDVGNALKSSMITAMANAFIAGIDALIWTAISGATPGYTETAAVSMSCDPTAPSTTCCMYGAQLYKEIVELEARMRAAGYGPNFFLLLHPRVATYLKYKEGGAYPPWVAEVEMDGNTLVKIGNIKVIEYCGATECTDAGGGIMAIMVDPARAVGEAYGYKPILKTDEDPIECDSTKLVYRSYVGIAALDTGAIGHIVNP